MFRQRAARKKKGESRFLNDAMEKAHFDNVKRIDVSCCEKCGNKKAEKSKSGNKIN